MTIELDIKEIWKGIPIDNIISSAFRPMIEQVINKHRDAAVKEVMEVFSRLSLKIEQNHATCSMKVMMEVPE